MLTRAVESIICAKNYYQDNLIFQKINAFTFFFFFSSLPLSAINTKHFYSVIFFLYSVVEGEINRCIASEMSFSWTTHIIVNIYFWFVKVFITNWNCFNIPVEESRKSPEVVHIKVGCKLRDSGTKEENMML